jgi:BTB/POZ domain
VITFLLQRGADPNRVAKNAGNTPMDLARLTSPALCEMIANYGASSPSSSRRNKKPVSRLNLGKLGKLPRSKSTGDVLGHSRLLNDSALSDVVFNFRDQRVLHAHYFVLRCRAPGICKLFPKKERRKHREQTVHVDLRNHPILSYHAMKAVLRHVYTGQVNLVQMQDRHTTSVLGLWHAALQYDLSELALLCELHHNKFLSMANIYLLLKFAAPLHEPKIMRSCLEFATQLGFLLVCVCVYVCMCVCVYVCMCACLHV